MRLPNCTTTEEHDRLPLSLLFQAAFLFSALIGPHFTLAHSGTSVLGPAHAQTVLDRLPVGVTVADQFAAARVVT